jgi:hypothetical protein
LGNVPGTRPLERFRGDAGWNVLPRSKLTGSNFQKRRKAMQVHVIFKNKATGHLEMSEVDAPTLEDAAIKVQNEQPMAEVVYMQSGIRLLPKE